MMYPYRFFIPSDEQNAQRRHLLDTYGQFAQLSILLLPLLYYLSHGIQFLATTIRIPTGYQPVKEHQSPVISRFEQPPTIGSPGSLWARLKWALDDEVVEGWGTRKEWLITGGWGLWLLLLVVRDTGDGM